MLKFTKYLLVVLIFALYARVEAADIAGYEMKLPSQEREVKVVYFHAPGDAPRPAALLLHGAGGFDRRIADYSRYAAAVAETGIDAYLVYYYSNADIEGGGGNFEVRYPAWARLVDDLADYLLAQKTSNGKIGLVGFSNGGILATGAAVLDSKINAAVIYYGTEPWPLKNAIKRYPPLLVLHGDADEIIPVDAGRQLAEKARELGTAVDLVVYPNEVHGFGSNIAGKNGADALARTLAFLKKELLAP